MNDLRQYLMPFIPLSVLLLSICGPVRAQETVRTERLMLEVDAAQGAMVLIVLDETGAEHYRTDIHGLSIGGRQQGGFTVTGRDPLTLASAEVDLTLEVIDARTILAAWTPRAAGDNDFELRIRSDDPTRLYGTGERFNALNQRGYILPMITDDRYGNKGVGTHKPVPFVMSSRGFGWWLDTFAPSQFDLSGTERFGTRISVSDRRMRVYFFGGPDLAGILDAYTALAGRTIVPPPWAFGLWKSRDVHHNQDSVLVDIVKPREHGIPTSVIVLDSPWETGYNDFIVNREQFPDPESMFELMDRRGYVPALWLTPFVNHRNVIDMTGIQPASTNYAEAVERGVLVTDSSGAVASMEWWKGEGGLVDFTDPAAIEWWFGQLDKALWTGARAFKADDGEGNFVPDAVFHDGTPARLMKNRYAVLYDSVMQAYVDDRFGGDGALITRTGYTGTQRYPFAWAGDNHGDFSFDDGLPSVIIAGQNAAMSGFSLWGSDIAGYAGTADKEVFIRWAQHAAFTPFMQVHMTSNLGPWDFDDETLEIFRDFTRLRTQLFPYLYEAAHESARTGMPVIRPMALAFPDDPEAANEVYQYLFGPDILVAPVYRRATSRSVYIPDGEWIDFWTGWRNTGPATIEAAAPIDRMPLYIRAGAALPMIPEDVQTLLTRHDRLDEDIVPLDDRRVLEIWPGGSGSEVSTWDGLNASVTRSGDTYELNVSSSQPEIVAVRFPFRRVEPDGAEVIRTEVEVRTGGTIVHLPAEMREFRLTWSEPD